MISIVKKCLFCLGESPFNGLLGVLRKSRVLHYQLVKLVSKVVCASCASMAIVDTEKGAARPICGFFKFGLYNVKYN